MSNIVNGLAILLKPVNKELMLNSHGYGLSSYTISTRSGKGHAKRIC